MEFNSTFAINSIGILGTIASLVGAYLSIRSEKKARNSATLAEKARDQVIHKQQTTSLVTVLNESKRVQKIFFKYSLAPNDRQSVLGVDFDKDANELQVIITLFNESRGIITSGTELDADSVYHELNTLLKGFTNADDSQLKTHGHRIRLKLDDIIYKIQKSVDDRNYTI